LGAALELAERLDALAGHRVGAHQLPVQALADRLQRHGMLKHFDRLPVLPPGEQAIP
jgi:hypothetical protein